MCRELRKGKEPKNCAECLPELREENRDAVDVYLECQRQIIFSGMGDPVDIKHAAVWKSIETRRVGRPRFTFERVCLVSAHMIELWSDSKGGKQSFGE